MRLVVDPPAGRLAARAPLAFDNRSGFRGHRHDLGRVACPRRARFPRTAALSPELARPGATPERLRLRRVRGRAPQADSARAATPVRPRQLVQRIAPRALE